MVPDFPNLFLLTGPGSPSVLSNLFALNEYHVNWIADLITHLDQRGHRRVSTHDAAQSTWTAHVQELAQPLLRYNFSNYMVHVNHDDGSRLFVPYCGGLNRYVTHCDRLAREGYEGFIFE